jgi:hypothetical protein
MRMAQTLIKLLRRTVNGSSAREGPWVNTPATAPKSQTTCGIASLGWFSTPTRSRNLWRAGMKAMRASVARLKHPRLDTGIGTSRGRTGPKPIGLPRLFANSPAHTVDCLCHLSTSRISSGSPQNDDTRPQLHADAIERFCDPLPKAEPRTSECEDFSVHPSLARASATATAWMAARVFAIRPTFCRGETQGCAHLVRRYYFCRFYRLDGAIARGLHGRGLVRKDRRSP